MSADIKPFRIAVGDDVIDDLKSRLRRTRWPEAELVDDWSQGVPKKWLEDVCRYWADAYDWRKREALLNRFPQFTTAIDGVDIHFIHARSPHPAAMPLVITHGWPGSIVEFHKVIEPLVDPVAHGGNAADAFHVICPSLPGFGFSGKPTATGWGIDRIAGAWAKLMDRLGYGRYGAQGGDWGSAVTTAIGALDATHCAGIHITLAMSTRPNVVGEPTPEEARALKGIKYYADWDFGLLEAASDAAADTRLRPDRFARRPGGLDPGKVLGMDRLRRPSRERPRPRRAFGQRHAVLGDGDRRLLGSSLLGKLRRRAPNRPQGRRADRRRGVPARDRHAGAALDGSQLQQHPALERDAQGRPFRRLRAAGAVRRRRPRLLQEAAASSCSSGPRASRALMIMSARRTRASGRFRPTAVPTSSNTRSAAASRDGPARRPSARRWRLRRSRSGSASACRDR